MNSLMNLGNNCIYFSRQEALDNIKLFHFFHPASKKKFEIEEGNFIYYISDGVKNRGTIHLDKEEADEFIKGYSFIYPRKKFRIVKKKIYFIKKKIF